MKKRRILSAIAGRTGSREAARKNWHPGRTLHLAPHSPTSAASRWVAWVIGGYRIRIWCPIELCILGDHLGSPRGRAGTTPIAGIIGSLSLSPTVSGYTVRS